MRKFAGLAIAAMLVACAPPAAEKKADAGASSPAAPAELVGTKMAPGEWRTTVTMLEMTAPGLPPGAAARMAQRPIESTECVTAEDIDKFIGKRSTDEDSHCSFTDIRASGGHIEGTGSCTGEGGARTMTMSGDYGPSRVDVNMTVTGDMPAGPMSAKMHMLSERTGDCKS